MKTYLLFAALSFIILAGCSTSKNSTDYDDVYSTTKKKSANTSSVNDKTQVASPDYYQEGSENVTGNNPEDYETGDNVAYNEEPYLSSTETLTTPEGTTVINNYYEGYGSDDYYDYSYANRIDRFYGPYVGYNYYAPCYTGYYYDPWYWDSYWYRPSLYFGMSWGWGSMYWGYPYYYSYYPYNGYWYGYNQGYWNGYYDGYYGYGYNDYYGSYYYGHRSERSGSNSPSSPSSRDSYQNEQISNQAKIFERTTPQLSDISNPSRGSINSGSSEPGRSSSNSMKNQNELIANPQSVQSTVERNSNQTISSNQQESIGRNSTNNQGGTAIIAGEKNNSQNVTQDKARESNSSSRYSYKKPAVNYNETKGGYKPGQTIESNKSSNSAIRYSKPADHSSSGTRESTGQQGTTTGSQNRQVYSRPQTNTNNSYSKPSGYNSNSQNSSQPSRSSNNSYSQPSRSSTNSQPSNSSKSYSQPSRSSSNSGSYSSPSRSSSSGSYSSPSRSSSSSGSSSRSSSGSSGGSSSGGARGGRK